MTCTGEVQLGLPGQSRRVWGWCGPDTKGETLPGTQPQTRWSSSAAQPPPAPRSTCVLLAAPPIQSRNHTAPHLTSKPQLQGAEGTAWALHPAQVPAFPRQGPHSPHGVTGAVPLHCHTAHDPVPCSHTAGHTLTLTSGPHSAATAFLRALPDPRRPTTPASQALCTAPAPQVSDTSLTRVTRSCVTRHIL